MKYYMNLIQKEERDKYRIITVMAGFLMAAVSLVAVLALVKPEYDALSELETKYELAAGELERLTAQNENYDDVLRDYLRYGFGYLSDEERAYAGRGKVMSVIDRYFIEEGAVMKLRLSGNELAATLFDVSMEKASSIIDAMMKDRDSCVEYASTRTANNEKMVAFRSGEKEEIHIPTIEMKALFRDGGQGETE